MSTVCLDVAAVRARFSALRTPLAVLAGPGGTQVPDEAPSATARNLRESNANLGGAFARSRATEALVAEARLAAAAFVGCSPDETILAANVTTPSSALSRALGREFRADDEILVTGLDHDGNASPRLDLSRDRDLVVRFVDLHDDTTLVLEDLERLLDALDEL